MIQRRIRARNQPELARLGAAGRLGALVHAQLRIVNGVSDRYRAMRLIDRIYAEARQ